MLSVGYPEIEYWLSYKDQVYMDHIAVGGARLTATLKDYNLYMSVCVVGEGRARLSDKLTVGE